MATNCTFSRPLKLVCASVGGTQKVYAANYVSGNSFVLDTGDSSGSYTAVADNGDGTVTVTATNGGSTHNLEAGQYITLSSGAYDGTYEVLSVPNTNEFTIEVAFTATDTGSWAWETETNIVLGTSTANGTALTFFNIEQDTEKAEAVENDVIGENNSVVYEQMVTIELYGTKDQTEDEAMRSLVDQLIRGRFYFVCEDENGVQKLYGKKNGLKYQEGEGGPGKEFDSLNGFILTFMGREPEPAHVYDNSGDDSGTPAEAFTAFTFS